MKNAVVSILLISLLFCSLITTSISASPDSGLETLNEGKKYEFYESLSHGYKERKYAGNPKKRSASFHKWSSENELTLEIESVEEDYLVVTRSVTAKEGREECKDTAEYRYTYSLTEDDTSRWGISHVWNRDDDQYMDYHYHHYLYDYVYLYQAGLRISINAPDIVVGSWEDFTDPLDNISERLENVSDTCESFEYSLNVEDQKIELTADWKAEAYPSEKTSEVFKGTVTYECHQEITLEYEDFVIKNAKSILYIKKLEEIDQAFLEKYTLTIRTKESINSSLERKGFFAKDTLGIANWVWSSVGVGAAIVGAILFFRKRMRR
ncbi:MAG: hypothetical protein GWO20_03080 [Candidatus Korarchaeota archaeon]|nr:hypothetical protein [Candidatus Korarchaeota archaeon]NIU82470.1 hypothetical protein [Candidatus Thorarchaeota archaeon]NIW15750.1 hypothetical protein [Candidatus Thorarchaeota archaeon]NIW51109.1 hypothetical protein [Candidatus Korarchaeota archaeon]